MSDELKCKYYDIKKVDCCTVKKCCVDVYLANLPSEWISAKDLHSEFAKHGYAQGNYFIICHDCKNGFVGDKRATVCFDCAINRMNEVKTPEAKP